VTGQQRKFEVARHDADHQIRLAVEKNLSAQHTAVAVEAILPCGVAQHGHLLTLIVFLLGEETAEKWFYGECGQNTRGHPRGIYDRWIAHAGEFKVGSLVAAETGEAVGVAGVVVDIRNGHAGLVIPAHFGAL